MNIKRIQIIVTYIFAFRYCSHRHCSSYDRHSDASTQSQDRRMLRKFSCSLAALCFLPLVSWTTVICVWFSTFSVFYFSVVIRRIGARIHRPNTRGANRQCHCARMLIVFCGFFISLRYERENGSCRQTKVGCNPNRHQFHRPTFRKDSVDDDAQQPGEFNGIGCESGVNAVESAVVESVHHPAESAAKLRRKYATGPKFERAKFPSATAVNVDSVRWRYRGDADPADSTNSSLFESQTTADSPKSLRDGTLQENSQSSESTDCTRTVHQIPRHRTASPRPIFLRWFQQVSTTNILPRTESRPRKAGDSWLFTATANVSTPMQLSESQLRWKWRSRARKLCNKVEGLCVPGGEALG